MSSAVSTNNKNNYLRPARKRRKIETPLVRAGLRWRCRARIYQRFIPGLMCVRECKLGVIWQNCCGIFCTPDRYAYTHPHTHTHTFVCGAQDNSPRGLTEVLLMSKKREFWRTRLSKNFRWSSRRVSSSLRLTILKLLKAA